MARTDAFVVVCRCFGAVTAFAALLCIAVNVLYAVRSFMNLSHIFDGIFRCYAVLIAIFVVVAEIEWDVVMKFWKVFDYWVARGILQIFVAVMTRAYPEDANDQTWLVLLENIASYMLLACGVIYVIAGIFCIGRIKSARQSRDEAVNDSQEAQRRKQELEGLLVQQRA